MFYRFRRFLPFLAPFKRVLRARCRACAAELWNYGIVELWNCVNAELRNGLLGERIPRAQRVAEGDALAGVASRPLLTGGTYPPVKDRPRSGRPAVGGYAIFAAARYNPRCSGNTSISVMRTNCALTMAVVMAITPVIRFLIMVRRLFFCRSCRKT